MNLRPKSSCRVANRSIDLGSGFGNPTFLMCIIYLIRERELWRTAEASFEESRPKRLFKIPVGID